MHLPAPQSLPEFQRMFPDEEACQQYLVKLRWPEGFLCANCGGTAHYTYPHRRAVVCKACKKHLRLTSGTIMHRSKVPLLTWFYGAFLLATLPPGLSAVQFQRQLGLSRYETAFQLLHKLRSAMVAPGRERLHGCVEVDETLIGGMHKGGARGRSTEKKTLVVGAAEVRKGKKNGLSVGRIRLRAIPDATGTTLDAFMQEHVLIGTTVLTDGHAGYDGLKSSGYDHQPKVAADLPLIHREFANLKTWLRGTHHDRVERQHLQAYLNEFAFRHNRRFWPFGAFQRLLQIAIATAPTYRELHDGDEFGTGTHAG